MPSRPTCRPAAARHTQGVPRQLGECSALLLCLSTHPCLSPSLHGATMARRSPQADSAGRHCDGMPRQAGPKCLLGCHICDVACRRQGPSPFVCVHSLAAVTAEPAPALDAYIALSRTRSGGLAPALFSSGLWRNDIRRNGIRAAPGNAVCPGRGAAAPAAAAAAAASPARSRPCTGGSHPCHDGPPASLMQRL